jgi:hypothetical protein
MSRKTWRASTKRDLIIEVWEYLDCESVGASELRRIQNVLRERFGNGGSQSPASIARVVADEGASLRHPEVFELDYRWREENLASQLPGDSLGFSDLKEALESFAKIEVKRQQFELEDVQEGLKQLQDTVASARRDALLTARSPVLSSEQREQAKEISQWLGVWLQSPKLFPDWLDLRLRSPEFQKRFPR